VWGCEAEGILQGRVKATICAARSPAEGERVDGRPQDTQDLAQDDQV